MQQATETSNTTSVAAGPLKSLIERIERLECDKAECAELIKEGIRRIVRLRKLRSDERSEQEALLDLYLSALGMLAATPLGRHAAVKAVAGGIGIPVDPTAEEAAAGVIAAFEKDGIRLTMTPGGVSKPA